MSFHFVFLLIVAVVILWPILIVAASVEVAKRLTARPASPPTAEEIAFKTEMLALERLRQRRAPMMTEWGKTHPYPYRGRPAELKAYFEASKAYAQTLN